MNINLLNTDIESNILNRLSGERAKDFVIDISRFDRVQASSGTWKCIEMMQGKLSGLGISNIETERFLADGKAKYGTWLSCMGWNIRGAELWLQSPQKLKLADYDEIPISVVRGSQSANVTAELIDVGTGLLDKEYENIDVRGKIVLAGGFLFSTYAGNVQRQAVLKRGALGVIVYRDPQHNFHNHQPHLIPYYGMWNSYEENDKITFGFAISFEMAMKLKKYLQKEKVILSAYVNAENCTSTFDQMSCTMKGAEYPDEEILLIAHIDHYQPGAVDNASGSAALMEMARTLQKMLDQGEIILKRTVRFLWVTEFNSIIPWLQKYPENKNKIVAAINCDMIGGDLVKTQSLLQVIQTPFSQPHYINHVIANLTEHVASLNITSPRGNNNIPFNYRFLPYQGGSDHFFLNDSSFAIPTTMLAQHDLYYHTAQDIPDNIDPTQLKRVMFIALGTVLYLANAGETEAIELNALCTTAVLTRISKTSFDIVNSLAKAPKVNIHTIYKNGLHQLHWNNWYLQKIIASITQVDQNDICKKLHRESKEQIEQSLAIQQQKIQQVYQYLIAKYQISTSDLTLTDAENKAHKKIPQRKKHFIGPLSMPLNVKYQIKPSNSFSQMAQILDVQFEMLNFVDGKRSIYDIFCAITTVDDRFLLKEVEAFFDNLKQEDLLTFL